MLRITVTQSTASLRQLKLEGRVTGPSVAELRRQCESALARNDHNSLTLDLADVSFIDNDGVDLLRTLSHHNVTVARCSPFVAELLKEVLPCS